MDALADDDPDTAPGTTLGLDKATSLACGRVRPPAWSGSPPRARRSPTNHLMRLLVITQVVDSDDPVLAATVPKLRALAERCEELVVLTARVGTHDLPAGVTFELFGAPGRLRRGLHFVRALAPF